MYRYTEIIKTIRSIAPQAHIAGGAVRDTILEKEIRDIDIFVDDVAVRKSPSFCAPTSVTCELVIGSNI